jgi:hypothetical protein
MMNAKGGATSGKAAMGERAVPVIRSSSAKPNVNLYSTRASLSVFQSGDGADSMVAPMVAPRTNRHQW